jgi:hypothetical protein
VFCLVKSRVHVAKDRLATSALFSHVSGYVAPLSGDVAPPLIHS